MCGIAGVVTATGDDATIKRITDVLTHRGPDDQNVWQWQGPQWTLSLGATRLAILDLTIAASQPMVDRRTGSAIVFNGEVYNFSALRSELEAAGERCFESSGDTEVVLRGYLRWGPRIVTRLRGMFAFAIWDPGNQSLFLARDAFGIKPLYYSTGPGARLVFASEVRAVMKAPWVPRDIDPLGLAGYLAYGSLQDPLTLLKSIRALPAGHTATVVLRASAPVVKAVPYHVVPDVGEPMLELRSDDRESLSHRIRDTLRASVRAHLTSDVEVAAFLSSGIDSSTLVALAAECGAPIRTISIGQENAELDESPRAAKIAQLYGTRHTEVRLSASDILEDFHEWLADLDQPSADGTNVWIISRVAHRLKLKVALSGVGGDELFGGYPSFSRVPRAVYWLAAVAKMPASVRKQAGKILDSVSNRSRLAAKTAELLRCDGSALETYLLVRRMLLSKDCIGIMQPGFAESAGALALQREDVEALRRLASDRDVVNAVSRLETWTYMRNTLLRDTDQGSMAHSLEVRVPFVDRAVVDLLWRIPGAFKTRGRKLKPLLQSAMAYAPGRRYASRRKLGFMLPFDSWLKKELRSEVEAGFSRFRADALPIRADTVWCLWEDFLRGRSRNNASQMLALYALTDWARRNGIS